MVNFHRAAWPLTLISGEITLQPMRLRDRNKWYSVRTRNREWLEPWEATLPRVPNDQSSAELPKFFEMVAAHNREGRTGRSLSLVIWRNGELIGQISMSGIIYGALRGAQIGYWIDSAHANQGITTDVVKIVTKYGFEVLGLHRIEINLRPENGSSRRVAEKSGYHFEGERARYLHIDGQWRDHLCFVQENPRIN